MEEVKIFQYVKEISMQDISAINRALGVIEGLAFAVQDASIADALIGAIESIDVIINKENKDGNQT